MSAHETRHGGKAASGQTAVQWSEAYRALPDDETRSYAIDALRRHGFSLASVAAQKKARMVLAEALVRIEDRLEFTRLKTDAIRAVRRRLELELWP